MFSADELQALRQAKECFQSPPLIVKITDSLGSPLEKSLALLPEQWQIKINTVTESALLKAINTAIYSLQKMPESKFSERWHKLSIATTGGIGGFFGASTIAIELPISTTIILRSIADIARSEGEDINDIHTKMACLEVFALGGMSKSNESTETGYFAVRAALSSSISDATAHITKKGLSDKAAPALVALIHKISKYFGLQVSQKAAAQALPAIGAAGGAILNTLFIDHFQNIARAHFIIRRLEREHGKKSVQEQYQLI